MIWRGVFLFSVAVDDVVVEGCDVVGVRLVDFGAMAIELDSLFGSCLTFELGGA